MQLIFRLYPNLTSRKNLLLDIDYMAGEILTFAYGHLYIRSLSDGTLIKDVPTNINPWSQADRLLPGQSHHCFRVGDYYTSFITMKTIKLLLVILLVFVARNSHLFTAPGHRFLCWRWQLFHERPERTE